MRGKRMGLMRRRAWWILLLAVGLPAAQAAQVCQADLAPQAVDARWQPLDEQRVRDKQTGLEWQRCSWGQTGPDCAQGQAQRLTWPQSQELIYRLNRQGWGEAQNWRLPTRAELLSLVRPGCLRPSIDLRVFPHTQALWFWSDDGGGVAGSDRQYVDFATGWPGEDDPQLANAVRLVRRGTPAG